MATGPIVEATLGLDTTAFQRGLQRANAAAAGFKGAVERLGLTSVLGPLTQGAGAGIVVGALVMGLRSAVQEAMRMREEAERTGVAIDDTTASAARLGDTIGAISGGLQGLGMRVAAEIQTTLETLYGPDAPVWRSIAAGGPIVGLLFRKGFQAAQDAAEADRERALEGKIAEITKRIDDERQAYLREQLNTEQLLEDVQGRIRDLKEQQADIDQSSLDGRRRYLDIELQIVGLTREEQRLWERSEQERRRADDKRLADTKRIADIERQITDIQQRRAELVRERERAGRVSTEGPITTQDVRDLGTDVNRRDLARLEDLQRRARQQRLRAEQARTEGAASAARARAAELDRRATELEARRLPGLASARRDEQALIARQIETLDEQLDVQRQTLEEIRNANTR